MKKQKPSNIGNYVNRLVLIVIVIVSISTIGMFIFALVTYDPTTSFKRCCEAMNGDIKYISNVSCELNFIYCDIYCDIDGRIIGFYDYIK